MAPIVKSDDTLERKAQQKANGPSPFAIIGAVLLLAASARAEVRVWVEDTNGVAWIKYECTAAEVVRAFALDVSVDRGRITRVSDFFRGESKSEAAGYGIFPASLRAVVVAGAGTNIDWTATNYTPLAVVADAPDDTLPGLNSSGVTLEFGGLWDPSAPAAVPGPAGTLCALQLSEAANVSLAANGTRGGIVSAFPDSPVKAVLIGAVVGPAITSTSLENGVMTVIFKGGELQTAASLDGPWASTGDSSGHFFEPVGANRAKFYRVRAM